MSIPCPDPLRSRPMKATTPTLGARRFHQFVGGSGGRLDVTVPAC